MTDGEWIESKPGCLDLRIGNSHIWIVKRPDYCDRGHYHADVAGIPDIDDADRFPRYYMNLERAKAEMLEWLQWRLQREGYVRK